MKFTVRTGYVIHDTRIVLLGGQPTEQTNSYYEGDPVDFDDETALRHLHKLEPADKAAEKFLGARAAPVSAPPTAGMDPAALSALIAQAVTAAVTAAMQASAQPLAAAS